MYARVMIITPDTQTHLRYLPVRNIQKTNVWHQIIDSSEDEQGIMQTHINKKLVFYRNSLILFSFLISWVE